MAGLHYAVLKEDEFFHTVVKHRHTFVTADMTLTNNMESNRQPLRCRLA